MNKFSIENQMKISHPFRLIETHMIGTVHVFELLGVDCDRNGI